MKFEQLIPVAFEAAKSKGFYAPGITVGEMFMPIIGECGEAYSAHRNGRRADLVLWENRLAANNSGFDPELFERYIKDTLEDELADIMLCTAGMCGYLEKKVVDRRGWNGQQEMNVGEQLLYITRCLCRATTKGCDIVEEDDIEQAVVQVRRLAHHLEINLDKHIELKMQYNATRAMLHGKNY